MRKTNGILAVAVVALAIVAAGQPAQANCAAPNLMLTADASGLEMTFASNPAWTDPRPQAGLYNVPAISPNFSGFFWAAGSGQLALGAGNDNGNYGVNQWMARYTFDGSNGTYFYNVYMQQPGEDNNPVNWTTPGIDGCITFPAQGGACACVLLSDEHNGQGYFAVLGDNPDPTTLVYNFAENNQGVGLFRLAPTPKPVIQNAAREPGTNHLLLQIGVPSLGTAGVSQAPGCNCVAGFKVYANVVPRGQIPPSGRRIGADGWVVVNASTGGAQATTPIGGVAAVRVDCGATNTDVYLATQIVGDSGFSTQLVSGNSTRVECGPNLADPLQRPRVPVNRPIPEGPSRGR